LRALRCSGGRPHRARAAWGSSTMTISFSANTLEQGGALSKTYHVRAHCSPTDRRVPHGADISLALRSALPSRARMLLVLLTDMTNFADAPQGDRDNPRTGSFEPRLSQETYTRSLPPATKRGSISRMRAHHDPGRHHDAR
jgi:vacuolar-type H+-ATPase subunit B/Vma2